MPRADALARPLEAEVDLAAIAHNIERIRAQVGGPTRLIVPVKANAYGHGVEAVALHLERHGVDAVATANVEEALALRQAGLRLPILMYASQLPAGIPFLLAHGLTPTVWDRAGVDAAAAAAGGAPVRVHVEVEIGFGRLGVRLDEAPELIRAVVDDPRLELEGVYAHAPFADAAGEAWARRRLDAFARLVRAVEAEHGIAIPYAQGVASAALLRGIPDALGTLAPGHLTYGLSPVEGTDAAALGYRPALASLRGRLIHVGRHAPGDDLASGRAAAAGRWGVVLLGIDNGYAWGAGSTVLVRGRRCPVRSVTAEYTVVDLAAAPEADVGDAVTFVGTDGDDAIGLDELVAGLGAPSAGYWLMGLRRVPIVHVG